MFARQATVTVIARPEDGYGFVRWEDEAGSAVSAEDEYRFAVTGDIVLTAVFFALLTE